jgi:hypothetical protein
MTGRPSSLPRRPTPGLVVRRRASSSDAASRRQHRSNDFSPHDFSPLVIGRFRDRSSVSFSLFRSLSWVAASPVARSHELGGRTFEINRAEEPRFR